MFFRFRALDYHSKLPKTLAVALKYCQLSSLTHINPTLDKICSGFQILDKACAGYQKRLILKLLPRTMLSSIIKIYCFVSNISCIAHLFKITFCFCCSNSMKVLQRLWGYTQSGCQAIEHGICREIILFSLLLFHNKHIADPTWEWGDTPWCDLSLDKTNISVMTGGCSAHPLLISLANISMEFWNKDLNNAYLLLVLLPIPKFIHCKRVICRMLEACLYHHCLDVVLAPLKAAAQLSVMLLDPLKNLY